MSNDAYKEKLATPPSPEKVKEMVAKTPMSGPHRGTVIFWLLPPLSGRCYLGMTPE